MIALIQARMGSSRLPGKVLTEIYEGKTVLDLVCEKLRDSNVLDYMILTSTNERDNVIVDYAIKNQIRCFRGSESDVLERFCSAIDQINVPAFIRVCADNPFLSLTFLNDLVTDMKDLDYLSHSVNTTPGIRTHFGLFAEAVNSNALLKLNQELPKNSHLREHVTAGLYTNNTKFKCEFIEVQHLKPNLRFTIDDIEDLEIMKSLLKTSNIDFGDPNSVSKSLINYDLEARMLKQIRKYEK